MFLYWQNNADSRLERKIAHQHPTFCWPLSSLAISSSFPFMTNMELKFCWPIDKYTSEMIRLKYCQCYSLLWCAFMQKSHIAWVQQTKGAHNCHTHIKTVVNNLHNIYVFIFFLDSSHFREPNKYTQLDWNWEVYLRNQTYLLKRVEAWASWQFITKQAQHRRQGQRKKDRRSAVRCLSFSCVPVFHAVLVLYIMNYWMCTCENSFF